MDTIEILRDDLYDPHISTIFPIGAQSDDEAIDPFCHASSSIPELLETLREDTYLRELTDDLTRFEREPSLFDGTDLLI
jgi:hypothetical protein